MLSLINIGLVICVVIIAAYYVIQWAGKQPYFAIHSIRIESIDGPLHHINPQAVREQILNTVRGNFLNANLAEIRDAFKAMPWIRRAQVQRQWPNRLVIRIAEYQPLGRWGEHAFLSTTGDVFEVTGFTLPHAPQFNGPTGTSSEVLQRYLILQQSLKDLQVDISALTLSDRLAWQMRLNNGMTIELGRDYTAQTIEDRVRRLVLVFPRVQHNLPHPISQIDLRYPNGFALGLAS